LIVDRSSYIKLDTNFVRIVGPFCWCWCK